MQFGEGRLPNLTELDAVDRPVYIQAAQGGARTNSRRQGVARGQGRDGGGRRRDRRAGGGARAADASQDAPDAGDEEADGASTPCSTTRGSASPRIATRARSTPTSPPPGIASENTYTMHKPFLALNREERMPARLRIDFLHQDAPTAEPAAAHALAAAEELVPVLRQRLAEDRRHRRVHGRRAGGLARDREGRMARRGSRAEPGRRDHPHRQPRDRESRRSRSRTCAGSSRTSRDFPRNWRTGPTRSASACLSAGGRCAPARTSGRRTGCCSTTPSQWASTPTAATSR